MSNSTQRQRSHRTNGRLHAGAFALAACTTMIWQTSAHALERPRDGQVQNLSASDLERVRALGNNLVAPQLLQKLNVKLPVKPGAVPGLGQPVFPAPHAAPIPDEWTTLPSTGNVKVLALLISFQDYPASVSAATVQSMLFGDGNPAQFPRESLRRYYERSSYGQLSITGNALGWFAAGLRSTVAKTDAGREALIKQALNSFEAAGHDFSQYDNDNDGVIDYMVVMWTGPDEGWGSFWWGYQPRWSDGTYLLDGKRLGNYSWQWEASSPTVVIHETGHALGLPDYYDYPTTKLVGPPGGLGGLDMMDANTGDHNCFSKFLLGWLKPTLAATGSGTLSLQPSSVARDCILVMPGCSNDGEDLDAFSEFYLIENRTRVSTANDQTLPGDGFLIWHIHSQVNPSTGGLMYNNQDTSHKLIRVMEADGLEEIESGFSGDAGDYWSTPLTFSSSSAPACAYYNGDPCPFDATCTSAPSVPMSIDVSYEPAVDLTCFDFDFIEVQPLCAIVDCYWQKPGDDVIDPPDIRIRERFEVGDPVIDLQAGSVLTGVKQVGAAKVKQSVVVH